MMADGLDLQSLSNILGLLKSQGFNSVRLMFSNYLLHAKHRATAAAVAQKNPELAGLTPVEAFYRVANMITQAGLYVIVDDQDEAPPSTAWTRVSGSRPSTARTRG